MAMQEWVDNPHAETALSNILPCVDQRTTNRTLIKSKQVVVDIANVVNGFIDTYANSNPTDPVNSNYYNQSGPLMPHLCYPYDSQLQDLPCPSEQVSVANASLVSVHLASFTSKVRILLQRERKVCKLQYIFCCKRMETGM